MYCCVCKKYKYPIFCLSNKLLCSNHSKLLYNNNIIIIQKTYRGYRKRKYLANIFKKLPRDLQLHILEFNTPKTRKRNYINNRLRNFCCKINNSSSITSNKISLKESNAFLEFILKYKSDIDYKWKNYYNFYFNNICHILLSILKVEYFPNIITNVSTQISIEIYDSIDFTPNIIKNDFFYQLDLLLNNTCIFLKN